MIRLLFKDKFCDSLEDLKSFLKELAEKDEKNAYHISVADKFRGGIIEKWLIQEKAWQVKSGTPDRVDEIDALIAAVQELSGKLDNDREIFSCMMGLFCNQAGSTVTVNPYRYIGPKECIVRFDRAGKNVTGLFQYTIVQEAKEAFNIYAELGGERVFLVSVKAKGEPGHVFSIPFSVPLPFAVNSTVVLSSARIFIDKAEFNDGQVFMDTAIPDVFLRFKKGVIHLCRKEGDNVLKKVAAIAGRDFISLTTSEKEYLKDLEGFSEVGEFNSMGVAAAFSLHGHACFLYKDGRTLPAYAYRKAWLVGCDMAAVQNSDYKVGFVDKNGNIIYESVSIMDMRVFSDGYLAVKRKTGDWGFMDKNGVIVGSYAKAGDFHGGFAIVYRESFYGYGGGWKIVDREFLERDIDPPSEWRDPEPAPLVRDGMEIKDNNASYGIFNVDDHYPVPIIHYLPDIMEEEINVFNII